MQGRVTTTAVSQDGAVQMERRGRRESYRGV